MKRLIKPLARIPRGRAIVLTVIMAALACILYGGWARAQTASFTYANIERALWHSAYDGIQVTTVTGPRQTRPFESRVIQDANGHRSVRVTGPPRRAGELQVDDGFYRWHWLPRKKAVELQPSEAAHHPIVDRRRLQPSISPGGIDTVAGRATTIYTVIPVRPQSPTLKLWVDNATALPLRTDWDTRDGRHISEVYTSIHFGSAANVSFRWPHDADLQVHNWVGGGNKGAPVKVTMPLALPRNLPPGVFFDGIWNRELAGRQVLFLRFNQGRHTASVFETVGSAGGAAPQGPQIENWNLGSLNLTLVSDLPAAARARLRASMRIVHTAP